METKEQPPPEPATLWNWLSFPLQVVIEPQLALAGVPPVDELGHGKAASTDHDAGYDH